MDCIKSVEGGIEILVKVVPGASRDRIAGELGDALKIQVSAPPEKGKANAAVATLLARALGVHAKDVSIIRGTTSPRKTLLISGVAAVDAAKMLSSI